MHQQVMSFDFLNIHLVFQFMYIVHNTRPHPRVSRVNEYSQVDHSRVLNGAAKGWIVIQMVNVLIYIFIHILCLVYTVQRLDNFITCVNIHSCEQFWRKDFCLCNTNTTCSHSPHNRRIRLDYNLC